MSGKNGRHDFEPEPEAGPEWISRGEARALLGVGELELREIIRGLSLSRRVVPLYLKAEIQALVPTVQRLR